MSDDPLEAARAVAPRPDAFTSFPLDPLHPVPGEAGRAAPIVRGAAGRRGVVPAVLAEALPNGDVRCHACAHRCLVRPDRRAICGVRENREGRLVTLVHGEVAAAVVEPIEKKPLYHAWPGTTAFSVGTQGCNFHCRFCHNWEIAQAPREGLIPRTRRLPPESAVAEALAVGARSIAYTYVEPTVFLEYVLDAAPLAHAAGLGNVLVSNGYQTPEALALLAPHVDAVNVDLKSFSDRVYRRLCGARLAPVLEALVELRRLGVWVEVTTLLVPGVNDEASQLGAMAEWIGGALGPETPWHVSRFFPAYRMLVVPPTPASSLAAAAELGRRVGLRHVYAGNAPELGLDDTRCAGCGALLLRRSGHGVAEDRLVDGTCPRCRRPLAGVGLGRAAARPAGGARDEAARGGREEAARGGSRPSVAAGLRA